jgi:hypothetical protein
VKFSVSDEFGKSFSAFKASHPVFFLGGPFDGAEIFVCPEQIPDGITIEMSPGKVESYRLFVTPYQDFYLVHTSHNWIAKYIVIE